jgi:hypothetical protein
VTDTSTATQTLPPLTKDIRQDWPLATGFGAAILPAHAASAPCAPSSASKIASSRSSPETRRRHMASNPVCCMHGSSHQRIMGSWRLCTPEPASRQDHDDQDHRVTPPRSIRWTRRVGANWAAPSGDAAPTCWPTSTTRPPTAPPINGRPEVLRRNALGFRDLTTTGSDR